MVEKNLMCPSCREESFEAEKKQSWEDIRGLSWLFCEDCANPLSDKEQFKRLASCA